MDSLQTAKLGSFNNDTDISKPDQITSYVDSIVSADNIAIGNNSQSTLSSIAIGKYSIAKSESITIGHMSYVEDTSDAVIVGSKAYAKDYGTAIGYKSYSNLGVAFGADACALSGHSIALGRYACVSAEHAVQINGDKDDSGYVAINKEAKTLKFYNGTDNITIVNKDGKISADYATKVGTVNVGSETNPIYLNNGVATTITSYTGNVTGNVTGNCSGNSATATKLQTAYKIGGSNFDGSADISVSATTSLSVNVKQKDNSFANMRMEIVSEIPEPPEEGVLYFTVK